MTVYCPNCGKPNTDEAAQCVACGTELSKPQGKAGSRFKGTMMMTGLGSPGAPPGGAPPAGAPPAGAPAPDAPKNMAFQATMLGPVSAPDAPSGQQQGGFGAPPAGSQSGPGQSSPGQSSPGGFGAPAPQQGGFGAPPAGQQQGGFGAPPAGQQQGGFGAPPSGQEGGFGAPQSGGSASGGGFGAPPSGDSGGGFGAPPSGGQGGFGAPAGGGFGNTPAPGGGFGAPPSSGGGFGGPPGNTPPPGGGFGGPPGGNTPPPGGGFGGPPGGGFGGPPGGGAPPGGAGFGGPPAGAPPGGGAPSGGGGGSNTKLFVGIGIGCLVLSILVCVGSYFYCKMKTQEAFDGLEEGLGSLGPELNRISVGLKLSSIKLGCVSDPSGAGASSAFHPAAFSAYQGMICQVNDQVVDAFSRGCSTQPRPTPCSDATTATASGDAGRATALGLDPATCYTYTSGQAKIVGCQTPSGFQFIHAENLQAVQ